MKKTSPSDRPYVICLMMTSVDGKILSEHWGKSPRVKALLNTFEQTHDKLGIGAWIVGRTTMEKDFTDFAAPVLKKGHQQVDRQDFVAAGAPQAKSFAIAVDGHAKLGWKQATMQGDQVITILTEGVPDAYLAHLQDIGVSYLFAGATEVDLPVALRKLRALFGIEKLMLEGGGHLNGSFLNEGLIDELHQLLLPLADGTANTATLFDTEPAAKKAGATLLKLVAVKQLDDDVVHLTYHTAYN